MSITIKDVAEIAGVSIATVSRTLSRPEAVSESTREKVHHAIAKSGYVTNLLASNFRRSRSQSIVVLVPNIRNPFYAAVIQGIEKVAFESGYRVLISDTLFRQGKEFEYLEMFRQKLVDGIICLGDEMPFDSRSLSSLEVIPPTVMACEYHGSMPVPSVVIDNVAAAKEMTQFLIKLGHRRIGFINGPEAMAICEARFMGYRYALQEAKIRYTKRMVLSGEFNMEAGFTLALDMLKSDRPPTAIFCASDELAVGAMNAVNELGLRIPEDISVAGFDDLEITEYCRPSLTTVHQPRIEIGEMAMSKMLSLMNKECTGVTRCILPHKIKVRSSVDKVKIDS